MRLLMGLVFAVTLGAIPPAMASELIEGTPLDILKGQKLYMDHCAQCHGANLEGETPDWRKRKADGTLPAPPHDATGHTWHHSDSVLFVITKHGGQAVAPPSFKSAMPGFGDQLSDAEIRSILAYIKSRWPKPEWDRQRMITEQELGR